MALVEPNFLVRKLETAPNDSLRSLQHGLDNIKVGGVCGGGEGGEGETARECSAGLWCACMSLQQQLSVSALQTWFHPSMAVDMQAVTLYLHKDPRSPPPSPQHCPSSSQASLAWDVTTGSADVAVCVVDTGIVTTHPDLVKNYAGGYNAITGSTDPSDTDGHG